MIVGSIKENLSLEKRVSITPETAKNIINLGLKVIIENNYATHIGISDKEYQTVGVEIKKSSKELNISRGVFLVFSIKSKYFFIKAVSTLFSIHTIKIWEAFPICP